MALQLLPAADPVDGQPGLPELRDADYLREVLCCQGDGATEADIELELNAKASALGIELPLLPPARPPTEDEPGTPAAESSADSLVSRSQHARTGSSASTETAISVLTAHGSTHSADVPAVLTDVSSKRRSKTLTFAQYENYLSQVDPALDQPRFLRPNHDGAGWSAGIVIRPGARRRVRGLTQSIVNRLRKMKSTQTSLTPM